MFTLSMSYNASEDSLPEPSESQTSINTIFINQNLMQKEYVCASAYVYFNEILPFILSSKVLSLKNSKPEISSR